jgi:hypothetical protein
MEDRNISFKPRNVHSGKGNMKKPIKVNALVTRQWSNSTFLLLAIAYNIGRSSELSE